MLIRTINSFASFLQSFSSEGKIVSGYLKYYIYM